MKQAFLVFFALILLRWNASAQPQLPTAAELEYQTVVSNACIHGYRMVGEDLVNLTPLIHWYLIKKVGPRPLQEWKLILGTVATLLPDGEGMLVQTEARFSPDQTSYQVRLKNHPHEKFLSVGRPVQILARRDGTRYLMNTGVTPLESFDYGLVASKEQLQPILEKANAELEAKRLEIAGGTNKTVSARDETDTELVPRSLAAQQSMAASGHAKARYYLGLRYWQGDGVPKDEKKALELLNQSAGQGCELAVRFLARNQPPRQP